MADVSFTSRAMPPPVSTITQAAEGRAPSERPPCVPGLVVVFANRRPRFRVLRWQGTPLELGRLELAEDDAQDPLISRRHVQLHFDDARACWRVRDLDSRNGTFVAGQRVGSETELATGSLLRIGGVLITPVDDTLEAQRYGLGVRDGLVAGPTLRRTLETIALLRETGLTRALMIRGESGSGKELAARTFHAAGAPQKAPFVAVNCATIPKELAERLLFGAQRGAYSGATDAVGYIQAANGGTLFLDELAELSAEVQAKLLRVLETREVLRLGATRAEPVDVQVCAATWRDLRAEVAAGRFREDLYFRIGQPELSLPPLRERVEEIPWHVRHVLDDNSASRALEVEATFLEACALREWPGNVRELRAEVCRAAVAAARAGRPLDASDLSEAAGQPLGKPDPALPTTDVPEDEIAAALSAERGNVLAAARRLGVQRNKVRRWLDRHKLDARRFK